MTVEWKTSDERVDYPRALDDMQARAAAIRAGTAPELVWLLEHRALYTAGVSAKADDLIDPHRFPVHRVRRGGQYTYHGPGQRVVYTMMDVRARGADVRAFVNLLEHWVIATLGQFNIKGYIREGRVGVWVDRPDKPRLADGSMAEEKIAAIGIQMRKWVSFHGISINVDPDLTHFSGIVPCGIADYGVTSLVDLGLPVGVHDVDVALKKTFSHYF